MTNVGNLGFDLRFDLESTAQKLKNGLTNIKSSVGLGNDLGMKFSFEKITDTCNIAEFVSRKSNTPKDSPKSRKIKNS